MYIDWSYISIAVSNGVPTGWTTINDKNFSYFSGTDNVIWKQERSSTNTVIENVTIPDLLEVSRLYTLSGFSLQVVELFNQRAIPGGLGTFDGIIMHGSETKSDGTVSTKYNWYAKGIGQVLATSNQDGTGIKMQVVYKKLGTGAEYGTRPAWLTDAVISGLPTTW